MQKWTSIISGVLFVIVLFPVALITTFVLHLDVFGFWIGIITTEIFTNTLLFVLLYRVNWSACSEEVSKRVEKEAVERFSFESSTDNNIDDEYTQLWSPNEYRPMANQSLVKLIGVKLFIFLILLSLLIVTVVFSFK